MDRTVKFVDTTAVLAVFFLGLGFIHWISPLHSLSRISPQAFLVVAALLGLRYAARRQSKKREEILKAVPRRPLGLEE